MYVVDDERRKPIDFGSRGQKSRSNLALVGAIQMSLSPNLMMTGGTILILGHGVKGEGQFCPIVRDCHALRCLVLFCSS